MGGPTQWDTIARGLVFVGALMTIGGALMPWVEVDAVVTSITQSGLDREGWLTVALALVVLGIVGVRPWNRMDQAAVVLCGLLIFVVGFAYVADLALEIEVVPSSGVIEELGKAFSDPGIGVYVTALGGALTAAGGVAAAITRARRR